MEYKNIYWVGNLSKMTFYVIVLHIFALNTAFAQGVAEKTETATHEIGISDFGPTPTYIKADVLTTDELSNLSIKGVSAEEVSDYVFGNFKGEMKQSPPHSDINSKKAIIVKWENNPNKLVFSHEASYTPWLELPSGVALQPQFWEGNMGWGELMNVNGRKERNSFVNIIEKGPERVWVRWTYYGVNQAVDSVAFRGVEDWVSYPNGLVWRRQTYESLMPDKLEGYCTDPIELLGLLPVGKHWKDVLRKVDGTGELHAASVLDAYSKKRYDVYWTPQPDSTIWGASPRRTGNQHWADINRSKGIAMVMPFADGMPFVAFGDASGFPANQTRLLDNSFKDTGWGWVGTMWDYWPVGWRETQGGQPSEETLKIYPSCFATLGCRLVKEGRVGDMAESPLELYKEDIADMDFNRSTAKRVVYSLMGIGSDFESIRTLTREWLEKGELCARPSSIADLR